MAMTDTGGSATHVIGFGPPFRGTAGGTWMRGDPIGISGTSFVRADDDGGIIAEWIAGSDAESGDQNRPLFVGAEIRGGRFSGNVAGAVVYVSDTAGPYSESAGTNSRPIGYSIEDRKSVVKGKRVDLGG